MRNESNTENENGGPYCVYEMVASKPCMFSKLKRHQEEE